MTSIDPARRLAETVRTQLAAAGGAAGARGAAAPQAPAARGGRYTVSAAVARSIQAIAPQDPDRPGHAVRLYLQAQLAREFGPALLNDRAFPDLLDAVQQQMQQDPQTAAAVQALGALLLAGRVEPA